MSGSRRRKRLDTLQLLIACQKVGHSRLVMEQKLAVRRWCTDRNQARRQIGRGDGLVNGVSDRHDFRRGGNGNGCTAR